LKPSWSRYGVRPASRRYSVTTLEPGARLVLTQDCVFKPFSTAFLATRPAATITDGFEVLVQLVMAAITTEPWRRASAAPLPATSGSAMARPAAEPPTAWRPGAAGARVLPVLPAAVITASSFSTAALTSHRRTRSCGRRGPARLGSTVPRSSDSESEYSGSGEAAVWKRPCSFI